MCRTFRKAIFMRIEAEAAARPALAAMDCQAVLKKADEAAVDDKGKKDARRTHAVLQATVAEHCKDMGFSEVCTFSRYWGYVSAARS
jgi:hypothetical protein